MQRVIFAPSIDLINEANQLAKFSKLPIQIGDSIKTQNLIFDRDKISIISIPSNYNLFYFDKVYKDIAFRIKLEDEWHSYLNKQIKIQIISSNNDFFENPYIVENNCIIFLLRINKLDLYNFNIILNDEIVANGSFEVIEFQYDV